MPQLENVQKKWNLECHKHINDKKQHKIFLGNYFNYSNNHFIDYLPDTTSKKIYSKKRNATTWWFKMVRWYEEKNLQLPKNMTTIPDYDSPDK